MGCITSKCNAMRNNKGGVAVSEESGGELCDIESQESQDSEIEKPPRTTEEILNDLRKSIFYNNLFLCQKTLKHSSDLNALLVPKQECLEKTHSVGTSANDMPPLHLACMCRRPEIVNLLLKKGASAQKRDEIGRSPANVTLSYWPRVAPREFRKDAGHIDHFCDGRIEKEFWTKVSQQNDQSAKCLRHLLNNGADPSEVVDDEGCLTLLHICAKKELPIAIQLLVQYGANFEMKDAFGFTPLQIAVQCGNYSCLKKLLECGANINVFYPDGSSILHSLCANKKMVSNHIQSLYSFGIMKFVNKKCNAGHTPLHLAARIHCLKKTQLLLQYGADPDISDNFGRQPLFLALANFCSEFNFPVIRELAIEMTQIYMTNKEGSLPYCLLLARRLGSEVPLFDALISHSTTPNTLYNLSMQKVRHLLGKYKEDSKRLSELPLPETIVSDIMNFRLSAIKYWNQYRGSSYRSIQNLRGLE